MLALLIISHYIFRSSRHEISLYCLRFVGISFTRKNIHNSCRSWWLIKIPIYYLSGDDVIRLVEILAGNNHFTCFKPNLDSSLHDGDLCTSGNRSSYLSNGFRYWRLCGRIYYSQASDATWVSTSDRMKILLVLARFQKPTCLLCFTFRYNLLFYINPVFYGFSAITKVLLQDVQLKCENDSILNCISTDGNAVLTRFGFDTVNVYGNLLVS